MTAGQVIDGQAPAAGDDDGSVLTGPQHFDRAAYLLAACEDPQLEVDDAYALAMRATGHATLALAAAVVARFGGRSYQWTEVLVDQADQAAPAE